jgi:NAD(P)-dependent dehydrogenase (short-subunit alcohol dehydrogenase family)
MAQSIKGKTAIVTGSGSGINLAFATQLLEGGCNVVFADLSLRPEAQKVVDAHQTQCGTEGRAIFQKTDVRDWVQLKGMFKTAETEFGEVDIVCPGAGVYEPVCAHHWMSFLDNQQGYRTLATSGTLLAHLKVEIRKMGVDMPCSTSTSSTPSAPHNLRFRGF